MSEQPTGVAAPSPVPATPAPADTITSTGPEMEVVPGTFADSPPPTPPADTNTPPEPQTQETATTEPAPPTGEPEARVVPKAEEYVFPEGLQGTELLRDFAAKNDMTQTQLDNTMKEFGGFITASKQAEQDALRSLGEAHIKNWGPEGQYNLTLAKRALVQNDPDGALGKALNESGYGNHPAVLDFLYNLGKGMKEGGFLKSTVRRPPGQKTAAEAMYGDSHPVTE